MRRILGVLLSFVFLAGCLEGAPPTSSDAAVSPLAFDEAGARWVGIESGGCGLCSGAGGFGPGAEHHAVFVFENARVLLVDFNVAVSEDAVMSLGPNITYDAQELQDLLMNVSRARQGHAYVVRVHTGVTNSEIPANLARLWTQPGEVETWVDYGVHYAHLPAGGKPQHVELHGGLADEADPFHDYMHVMNAIGAAARTHGVRQGAAD